LIDLSWLMFWFLLQPALAFREPGFQITQPESDFEDSQRNAICGTA